MAAVVASKVKRQRQLALEQKGGAAEATDTQLIQRRAASASKEAAEKRKLSQYYSQVEGLIHTLLYVTNHTFLLVNFAFQYHVILHVQMCHPLISFRACYFASPLEFKLVIIFHLNHQGSKGRWACKAA